MACERVKLVQKELTRCLEPDPTLTAVYGYWCSKQASQGLPRRDDIAPWEIPALLPHVGLIDVLKLGENFRYRLIGTRMTEVFGHDFTGVKLGDECKDGEYGDFLHALYSEAVATRNAVYCESRFVYRDDRFMLIRRLLMPLADQHGNVSMLFFSNTFGWAANPDVVTSGSAAIGRSFPSGDIRRVNSLRRLYGSDRRH